MDNLEIAQCYLAAVEGGATGETLAAFYTPDAIQEELPNRFLPQGARRDIVAILEAAERGQRVMQRQTFTIRHAFVSGEVVILELLWIGIVAVPLGSLPAGGEMRAHFATVLEFQGGKIAAQRNYDCFEAF